MNRDDYERLAAEHVLGLLEGEERGQANALLSSDEGFRASVERWRKRFSEWDDTVVPVPAGEALWQRIETGLGSQAESLASLSVSVPPRVSPGLLQRLWESLSFWRTFGLAGAMATLLLAGGLGFFAVKASRQPVLIAVLMDNANQPGAVLRTFADGRAELTPLGDMQVPHNHSIQVWTFPDPNGAPVSMGIFHAAKTVRLNLENMPQPHSSQLFAISVEPLTGSPTGQPTGPVVMKGMATTAL